MIVQVPADYSSFLYELLSFVAGAAKARKDRRDIIRLRNKFVPGKDVTPTLKQKDLIRLLYFVNIQDALMKNLFDEMLFEDETPYDKAVEIHKNLGRCKKFLLTIPYLEDTHGKS